MSYKQFGDVVSFDTTYKTNKYHLPFAPFTGVNHHFQTIQFGCALLQDETEASFIWLFETWKDAMGGVEPVSMITDSDPAMKAAIPKVFPNTRHRLCYWHIKKNFGVNLSHLYYKKSNFKRDVKECLKFTFRIEDFERKWEALLVKYNLTTNNWLKGLYEDRAAWVHVYNRTAFFAGMNSTGRSEGINSFFKDYIRSTTNLKEFVEKYEKALKKIEEREIEADFMSEQKYPLLTSDSYLLNHAKTIYTKKIFEKFKKNWNLVEKYKSDVCHDEPEVHVVKFKKGVDEHWLVRLNQQTLEGTCECHFSEFVGIPCAHLLKVFSKLDMVEIPDYFIKQRWLKRANRFKLSNRVEGVSQPHANAMKLSQMCHEATQLAYIAYLSDERSNLFFDGIRELCEKISKIDLKQVENVIPAKPPSDEPPAVLLDPHVTQS
ncbi:hypothetical protein ACHQM5_029338 [Ranunculus cassubicifolius]